MQGSLEFSACGHSTFNINRFYCLSAGNLNKKNRMVRFKYCNAPLPPEITRLRSIITGFGRDHNPFIRHIVRRTRNFLENTIDTSTGEPYLKSVRVVLFGEGTLDALPLPPYLQDAYDAAEEFCALLGKRVKGAGFLKTLLLRRIGSTICAGRNTTEKMLTEWGNGPEIIDDAFFEEDDDTPDAVTETTAMKNLTPAERFALARCLKALENNQERDPKYQKVLEYLVQNEWLERGCIIFSRSSIRRDCCCQIS